MKFGIFALAALLLSSSAFADGQVFSCSAFETNEKGEVSEPLYTRAVSLIENGNSSAFFKNQYLSYQIAASQDSNRVYAKVSLAVILEQTTATIDGLFDLRSRNGGDMVMITNSYKPDGTYLSKIRLSCRLQDAI